MSGVLAVLVIEIDEHVTVHAIRRKNDQQDEVRDEQEEVEGVGLVETLEGLIRLLADEFAEAAALLLRENQDACEQLCQDGTPGFERPGTLMILTEGCAKFDVSL